MLNKFLYGLIIHGRQLQKHLLQQKTLGEIKVKVAKLSMEAAQKAECTITLRNKSKEEQDIDSRGRVGISGSIDMHWPGRGSGRSYNSDSGASYLMGHYTDLICAAWIFCKSCRTCFYHLKNKKNNPFGGNEIAKPH